jgi:hypothetical protein
MSVKFAPISKIEITLGVQPNGPLQKKLINSAYRKMGKYVPGKEGSMLNRNVKLTDHSIIYDSPYAHYQYISKLYVMKNGKGAYYSPTYGFWSDKGKKKTPTNIDLKHPSGGGPYWAEHMLSAEGDILLKEMQEYMRSRL